MAEVSSFENDVNRDGKADSSSVTLSVPLEAGEKVHHASAILLFNYALDDAVRTPLTPPPSLSRNHCAAAISLTGGKERGQSRLLNGRLGLWSRWRWSWRGWCTWTGAPRCRARRSGSAATCGCGSSRPSRTRRPWRRTRRACWTRPPRRSKTYSTLRHDGFGLWDGARPGVTAVRNG